MSLLDKAKNMRKFYNNNRTGFKLEDKEEFRIVRDTLVKYGLPTKNFDSNLPTLSVNENYNTSSMYGKEEYTAGTYNSNSNTLNLPERKEDYIHELFHMASNDYSNSDTLMGCKIRDDEKIFGEGLNEGITDYFTSLAVDGYTSRYPVEAFIASYIGKVYGMDIFKEHFNGDANKFYSSFGEDEKIIRRITELLDIFHYNISSYYKFKEKHSSNESQDVDMLKSIAYFKKNANKISDCFIDCISEFVKLLQLKKIDEKEFIGDLSKMLNTEGNEFLDVVKAFFLLSSYMGTDNIIKEINEEIDEDKFEL